ALPQTPLMRAALSLSIVAASFSIIIPFTLASVGPFEAAAIFALMTAGIPQELAATYAVVWHAGTVIVYAFWGVIGIINLGLSVQQIQQGAAALGAQPQD
ncbi:MAG: flippase-like domain-containing protein, partial [Gammaproteobacteria bacterium]|nr:flippase-like domain-containing protein [Gammaproteobacteria bacterium]